MIQEQAIQGATKTLLGGGLWFALALMLSSCTTLGPEYAEPEAVWMNRWETDLYGEINKTEGAAGEDPFLWWERFNDPVLNQLIEETKAANLSLRIAGLRILETRAQLGMATSGRYPQLQQASGNLMYTSALDSQGGHQRAGSYGLGAQAGWEMDFWGKYQRGIESADALFFSSIANQQNLQVLLVAQVAQLYFDHLTAVLRIDLAEKNAQIQKRSFELTTMLYEEGDQSELDLQQAKSQYMATLSFIPELEKQRIQLRNGLCLLLGRPPGPIPELDGRIKTLPDPPVLNVQCMPAQLLLRRPDIRAAAFQVAAQSAQIGLAESELYPSVSLLGSLGWTGLSTAGTPEILSLAIGPSFTWNIFDYGRIKNSMRVEDVRLQQAIENFQNELLEAAQEIDNAAISVEKTYAQREPQLQSMQAAQRSLELATEQYREGYADFQRVLDAQRAAASQEDGALLNQSTYITSMIDLYEALGGGWSEMTLEEMLPETVRNSMNQRTPMGSLMTTPLPSIHDDGVTHEP